MTKRIRLPHGIDPGDDRPLKKNLPEEEAVILRLYDLASACQNLYDAHGRDCDCHFCLDVAALDALTRMFDGVLDAQLRDTDILEERRQASRPWRGSSRPALLRS